MKTPIRNQAAKQIRTYLKKLNHKAIVHLSQDEDNLIYVDFKVNSTTSEKEIKDYQSNFSQALKKYNIKIEVRKLWF